MRGPSSTEHAIIDSRLDFAVDNLLAAGVDDGVFRYGEHSALLEHGQALGIRRGQRCAMAESRAAATWNITVAVVPGRSLFWDSAVRIAPSRSALPGRVRIDECQHPVKRLRRGTPAWSRVTATGIACGAAVTVDFQRQKSQVVLVNLCLNPDGRQVRDIVQRSPFLDVLPFADIFLDHVAADRASGSSDACSPCRWPALVDLVVTDAQQLQSRATGFQQLTCCRSASRPAGSAR